MKTPTTIAAAVFAALSLAACGGSGDDKLQEQTEDKAENQADAMRTDADNLQEAGENVGGATEENSDAQADAMRNQADAVEAEGEMKGEAIDDADVKVGN